MCFDLEALGEGFATARLVSLQPNFLLLSLMYLCLFPVNGHFLPLSEARPHLFIALPCAGGKPTKTAA